MENPQFYNHLIRMGVDAGLEIRRAINEMSIEARSSNEQGLLKGSRWARHADAVGDSIGINNLRAISHALGHRIDVVTDSKEGEVYNIGSITDRKIFAYFDSVDGTSKISGVGNAPDSQTFYVACDGVWAVGMTFTDPTTKSLEDLTFDDFQTSVIVDGNPSTYRTYPQIVTTKPTNQGIRTYEITKTGTVPVFTSSQTDLTQTFVTYETFQVYDRDSAPLGSEDAVEALATRLRNRNEGGAFNLHSCHCAFGGIQRYMLGWRGDDLNRESSGGAYISLWENDANMAPVIPVILGSGGFATDLLGNNLADRPITAGRTDVMYSANESIRNQLLYHIRIARETRVSV